MANKYDLIILGAGPAGLTAAVYASRYMINTLIIGKIPGGLITSAHEVCNFPTYGKIKGFDLAQKMLEQVKNANIQLKMEEANEISGKDGSFEVKTKSNSYTAKKIIIAIGTERRKLNIKGEKDFLGRGVSYCATCDAPLYKNKTACVVGGSDAALTAALLLAEYAKKVYIIYRKEKFFRAEPTWIEHVKKNTKIEPVFSANIDEIYGGGKVEGVKLDSGREIKLDGVFIEAGSIPDERFSKQLGLKSEDSYIIVNKKQETNVRGVFAAGDITNNPLKQAVTAAGEGSVAANSAYEEIGAEK